MTVTVTLDLFRKANKVRLGQKLSLAEQQDGREVNCRRGAKNEEKNSRCIRIQLLRSSCNPPLFAFSSGKYDVSQRRTAAWGALARVAGRRSSTPKPFCTFAPSFIARRLDRYAPTRTGVQLVLTPSHPQEKICSLPHTSWSRCATPFLTPFARSYAASLTNLLQSSFPPSREPKYRIYRLLVRVILCRCRVPNRVRWQLDPAIAPA